MELTRLFPGVHGSAGETMHGNTVSLYSLAGTRRGNREGGLWGLG